MPPKKFRQIKIKRNKTTKSKYKCKTSKRRTGAFDDIIAQYNGEIPIKQEEKPTFWQKTKKFVAGAATIAALGALGIYGLNKADIINWDSLKEKLANLGASAKEILGIKQALKEDNEKQRQENIKERQQIMNNSKKEWKGVSGTARYLGNSIRKKWNGFDDMQWSRPLDGNMSSTQQKLLDIIQRLKRNVYDVDFNQIRNALNYIYNDVFQLDFNTGWTNNNILQHIAQFDNFENEYDYNVNHYDQSRFNAWIYGRIQTLINIFTEYNEIKNNFGLK